MPPVKTQVFPNQSLRCFLASTSGINFALSQDFWIQEISYYFLNQIKSDMKSHLWGLWNDLISLIIRSPVPPPQGCGKAIGDYSISVQLKQTQIHREHTYGCQGGRVWRRDGLEFGLADARCFI